MTREYELVYIFDSALEEAQVNEHLDRFRALLESPDNPEPVSAAVHWGKRTLAYPIRGKEVGYYVVVRFAADPALLPELERRLKFEEAVIRYLLVVNEGLAPIGATAAHEAEQRDADDDSDEEDDE